MEALVSHAPLTLTIVLRGIDPPVTRTIEVDRRMPLSTLHTVIQTLFDGDAHAHHVFSDQEPFPGGFPTLPRSEADECVWFSDNRDRSWQPRRRWGDNWSMIDMRDPNLLSENGATLADVFRGCERVHYRCGDPQDYADFAWFTIDAHGEDDAGVRDRGSDASGTVSGASERGGSRGEPGGFWPTQVTGGQGRSPLTLLGVSDYARLLRAYASPTHPDHDAAVCRLERASGPWATFDPTQFDVEHVQDRLDRRCGGLYGRGYGGPYSRGGTRYGIAFGEQYSTTRSRGRVRGQKRTLLDALVEALPASNAAGLEQHIAAAGLDAPPTVTSDDAAGLVLPYTWLLAHAVDGVPVERGQLPADVLHEWADASGCGLSDVRAVQKTARDLRLVRTLKGQLVILKGAVRLAEDPLALWNHLAARLPSPDGYVTDAVTTLFLLAVADGSIAQGPNTQDADGGGLHRIARAYDILDGAQEDEWRRRRQWESRFDDSCSDLADTASPADRSRRRADPARVLPLLADIAERLAPLGLAHPTSDTWQPTPLLQTFARSALNAPTLHSLSRNPGF